MSSAAHSPAVLVVDDEAAVLTVVQRALENTGYRVLAAAGAGDALDLLGSVDRDVAVAIVDCGVSCNEGSELTAQLRGMAPGMRILMTSGRPAETLPLAPGTRFLAKPFTPQTLRQAVLGEILAYEAARVMARVARRSSGA